jgi:hypothetical protein
MENNVKIPDIDIGLLQVTVNDPIELVGDTSTIDASQLSHISVPNNYFDFASETTMADFLHTRVRVMDSIDQSFMKKSLLFLCRIWHDDGNMFKYHVAYTDDLETTLGAINDTYRCKWLIEILTIQYAISQNDEVLVRYDLLTSAPIENSLYAITKDIFDHMCKFATHINPFYAICNNNQEKYLGKKITPVEHTGDL